MLDATYNSPKRNVQHFRDLAAVRLFIFYMHQNCCCIWFFLYLSAWHLRSNVVFRFLFLSSFKCLFTSREWTG